VLQNGYRKVRWVDRSMVIQKMRKIQVDSRFVSVSDRVKIKAYSSGSSYVLRTYGIGSISGGIAFCIGTSAPMAQTADKASKRNVKKRPMVNKQAKNCCVFCFPTEQFRSHSYYLYLPFMACWYGGPARIARLSKFLLNSS
jgi:hypothetical protein